MTKLYKLLKSVVFKVGGIRRHSKLSAYEKRCGVFNMLLPDNVTFLIQNKGF